MVMSQLIESTQSNLHHVSLDSIETLDHELELHFRNKLTVANALSRSLVSFQANKSRPLYRWYKYKEAFSAALVEYLFAQYGVTGGKILDPFAGSGTAQFAASALGLDADGIELLPIGVEIINSRCLVQAGLSDEEIARLDYWCCHHPWKTSLSSNRLPELRITRGAYSNKTKSQIEAFLATSKAEPRSVEAILRFALLCILESVSYTRKDGQYLRWDYRSGRTPASKPFDKGIIYEFEEAIITKLKEILDDILSGGRQIELFPTQVNLGQVRTFHGSCLDILPQLEANQYTAIMTSPPYCNRYDYTRTYALELALLGVDEHGLAALRQQMVSCTVENRAKDLLSMNPNWARAIEVTDQQDLLQTILSYLEQLKTQGMLNNNGIPRMVRGYFYEMACVIAECARVMKPDAPLFMVNDNVRYAGATISVDLILSKIAEELGFSIECILVLPNGKGNSSQQMGEHGREPLRKCVYIWRKQ
ncbi:MAG: site-specific DNA-methyltransferase [Caldilineaceae bacterium]|nr:site-specific DNA-methyltransferase [Caldilineaceae bacterium]